MKALILFVAASSSAVWCSVAMAGTISLQIAVETTVKGGNGICTVRVTDLGDEAATALQTALGLEGQRFLSETIESLAPGATAQQEIRFPLEGLPLGVHYGIVEVSYADLNGYPFTALAYARIVHGGERSSTVLVAMSDSELSEVGARLAVRVRNLGSSPVTVGLQLALPRELVTEERTRTFELAGEGEHEALFIVKNFSALVGSRYPVFAVVDYESDELHFSSLAREEI
jgi:hypothetical protein